MRHPRQASDDHAEGYPAGEADTRELGGWFPGLKVLGCSLILFLSMFLSVSLDFSAAIEGMHALGLSGVYGFYALPIGLGGVLIASVSVEQKMVLRRKRGRGRYLPTPCYHHFLGFPSCYCVAGSAHGEAMLFGLVPV